MAVRPGQLALFLLTLQLGCSGMGTTWKFTRPPGPSRGESQVDQVDRDISPEQAPAKTSEPLVAELPARGKRSHPPATRMMIEAELRDATPEEKAEWIAFLDGVEPEAVPYVLRARRIEQNRKGHSVPPAAPTTTPKSESSIQIASHASRDDRLPTVAEQPRQISTEPPTEPAVQVGAAVEPFSEDEAPVIGGETDSASSRPKRLRSLGPWEATKLWPSWPSDHSSVEGTSERWSIGRLPLTLGSVDPEKVPPSESTLKGASTSPSTPPADAVSIRPGSEVWEDEVFRLISLLEAETSNPASGRSPDSNENLRRQITLRLLYLAVNQPEKAQRVISGLSPERQEFWTAMIQAMSHQLSDQPLQASQAGLTISELRSASFHLQKLAALEIRQLTFCTKIHGFGNYESFSIDSFTPSQAVLLYSEIRNFGTEPTVDGDYRTRIKSVVEIYRNGLSGEIVDRRNFDVTEDRCRSIRGDYFHSYRLDLPAHLTPGPYVLKLLVEDLVSGKTATETIPFTVE